MARKIHEAWVHDCFKAINDPKLRFIYFRSGRDAGKSWGVCITLLLLASDEKLRCMMTREVHKSLRESSWRLLRDLIIMYEMEDAFKVTERGITGNNGSEFVFAGLKDNTVESLKSYEGINLAVVEEAQTVSKRSIGILEPTIREEGSKVIYLMNPRFPDDPAYVDSENRKNDPDCLVIDLSYLDNHHISNTSLRDIVRLKRDNYNEYLHRYEGHFLERSDAAIYQNWTILKHNEVADFEASVPATAQRIMGADWGDTAPTALVRALHWPGHIYVTHEAVKTRMAQNDIPGYWAGDDRIMLDRGQEPRWKNPERHPGVPNSMQTKIIADNNMPERIRFLESMGFDIMPCQKTPTSVKDGIDFIKAHKVYVHPDCTNTVTEQALYSYKVNENIIDPKTEKPMVTEVIDKQNDHCMDALRYATEALRKPKRGSKRNLPIAIQVR